MNTARDGGSFSGLSVVHPLSLCPNESLTHHPAGALTHWFPYAQVDGSSIQVQVHYHALPCRRGPLAPSIGG